MTTEFIQLDKEVQFKMIDDFTVFHPNMNEILALIELCHYEKTPNEPECLLITGDRGSGKTTIMKQYVKAHNKFFYTKCKTRHKILYGEIPTPTQISTVVDYLQWTLKDPLAGQGKLGTRIERLIKIIHDCKVELIMLDEFQHFIYSEKDKVISEVADWFKMLINRTQVPVVLFGQNYSRKVLEANDQLSRRFPIRRQLAPLTFDTDEDIEYFQRFLDEADRSLGDILGNPSNLSDYNMAQKIYEATDGVLNSIMKLIRRAAKFAVQEDKAQIELIDFAKSFELYKGLLGEKRKNPFLNSLGS